MINFKLSHSIYPKFSATQRCRPPVPPYKWVMELRCVAPLSSGTSRCSSSHPGNGSSGWRRMCPPWESCTFRKWPRYASGRPRRTWREPLRMPGNTALREQLKSIRQAKERIKRRKRNGLWPRRNQSKRKNQRMTRRKDYTRISWLM